ncbi:conserved hypothetical protein [Lodderomyces elongisporus NRRL YB-4239]|uniref:Pantothenate kinase n=1 Tax=Lodderomyces elongisporus (strain ATCC 11503 / CBS 2605 / JCM 1781 / NBRC 1676 / NRRL YB-4239) TaxID=379508 RepID=A5E5A1_LODEL|nr:conserved hypothetical protein [Lodderomyces elongisporus NRRL YB-4239]
MLLSQDSPTIIHSYSTINTKLPLQPQDNNVNLYNTSISSTTNTSTSTTTSVTTTAVNTANNSSTHLSTITSNNNNFTTTSTRRHRLSVSHEDINLELADPGTIRIDCSGAFIANDNLLRSSILVDDVDLDNEEEMSSADYIYSSNSPSQTPSASLSNTSSDLEEEGDTQGDADGEEYGEYEGGNSTSGGVITKNNINLPQHNDEIIHISVDIGGTLTKLIYFSKSRRSNKNSANTNDSGASGASGAGPISGGGKLHFRDFQTENFKSEVMKFIIQLITKSISKETRKSPITYIMATGGGAHKFYNLMTKTFKKKKLPMQIIKKDEMECLIKGLDWLITKIPQEIFIYDLNEAQTKFQPIQTETEIYPYLLVNIGSGVSMIKVTKPGPLGFERIGGSSLGGGTLWGLLLLLTDAKDYNEMLEMAQRGNNENIDLLVGDIYGTNYNKIGLKATHIASSFAKVFKKLRFGSGNGDNDGASSSIEKRLSPAEKLAQFNQEDIARSLLFSISNNIGQIAYLHALRFGLKRIYFGGSYISGHLQTIHTLSYAVNFWSGGEMQSYFLRHEGYLGSVGAFMMGPAYGREDEHKG